MDYHALGKTGLEAQYETELRGTYGSESVERDATGRRTQVLQTISQASPGDSLNLTIDTKEQKYAETALKWAMNEVGLKRGVVIVTSQVDPRGWLKLFEDAVVGEAIVDRLLHPSQRVVLKGGSYRERLAKKPG